MLKAEKITEQLVYSIKSDDTYSERRLQNKVEQLHEGQRNKKCNWSFKNNFRKINKIEQNILYGEWYIFNWNKERK